MTLNPNFFDRGTNLPTSPSFIWLAWHTVPAKHCFPMFVLENQQSASDLIWWISNFHGFFPAAAAFPNLSPPLGFRPKWSSPVYLQELWHFSGRLAQHFQKLGLGPAHGNGPKPRCPRPIAVTWRRGRRPWGPPTRDWRLAPFLIFLFFEKNDCPRERITFCDDCQYVLSNKAFFLHKEC